jgi:hypothetical protein
MKGTYSFSKQYMLVEKKIVSKIWKKMKIYHFSIFLDSLKLNENTCIEFEEKINKVTFF